VWPPRAAPAAWMLRWRLPGELCLHATPTLDTLLLAYSCNDKLIKEAQVVWIKYTRSRAERYTHDT
jgi:hypothetical protein